MKISAPIVSGTVAIILAIVKFSIGIASGSMAVLSSAIDSLLDCLVSALNYFALKKSSANPNIKFNFGYGKLEALMALIEGTIIIGIGIFIFYSSVVKISNPQENLEVNSGIIVMLFSIILTGILVSYLKKEYKKSGNLIIKADALHYQTDLLTNTGVLVALVLIWLTGYKIIDAFFGIVISIYIAFSAFRLVKEGIYILLDGAVDEEIVSGIIQIIKSNNNIKSYHYLKTRKSGVKNYFSIHLVFDPEISLSKAHEIGNIIENAIKSRYINHEWVFDTHFDIEDDSLKEQR